MDLRAAFDSVGLFLDTTVREIESDAKEMLAYIAMSFVAEMSVPRTSLSTRRRVGGSEEGKDGSRGDQGHGRGDLVVTQ